MSGELGVGEVTLVSERRAFQVRGLTAWSRSGSSERGLRENTAITRSKLHLPRVGPDAISTANLFRYRCS